jgi:hypothetical protein
VFVSIKGSARTWFEAALARGDAGTAWASAHELGRLSLDDAARLLLVLDPRSAQFERSAVRWLARLLDEVGGLTLADVQLAAVALSGLPSAVALEAFAAVCDRAGLATAAQNATGRVTA